MLSGVSEGAEQGYLYARGAHPNQTVLERLVARLEGAESGLACASGMGAITAAIMAGLKSGDRIVADEALYGRTASLIAVRSRRSAYGQRSRPERPGCCFEGACRACGRSRRRVHL